MLSLHYEYKVVPAPRRAQSDVVAKSNEARFAASLNKLMNEMGRQGWEYQRADTLPMEEGGGLRAIKTSYQNLLVFRRVLVANTRASEPINEELLYPDVSIKRAATVSLPNRDLLAKPRRFPPIVGA